MLRKALYCTVFVSLAGCSAQPDVQPVADSYPASQVYPARGVSINLPDPEPVLRRGNVFMRKTDTYVPPPKETLEQTVRKVVEESVTGRDDPIEQAILQIVEDAAERSPRIERVIRDKARHEAFDVAGEVSTQKLNEAQAQMAHVARMQATDVWEENKPEFEYLASAKAAEAIQQASPQMERLALRKAEEVIQAKQPALENMALRQAQQAIAANQPEFEYLASAKAAEAIQQASTQMEQLALRKAEEVVQAKQPVFERMAALKASEVISNKQPELEAQANRVAQQKAMETLLSADEYIRSIAQEEIVSSDPFIRGVARETITQSDDKIALVAQREAEDAFVRGQERIAQIADERAQNRLQAAEERFRDMARLSAVESQQETMAQLQGILQTNQQGYVDVVQRVVEEKDERMAAAAERVVAPRFASLEQRMVETAAETQQRTLEQLEPQLDEVTARLERVDTQLANVPDEFKIRALAEDVMASRAALSASKMHHLDENKNVENSFLLDPPDVLGGVDSSKNINKNLQRVDNIDIVPSRTRMGSPADWVTLEEYHVVVHEDNRMLRDLIYDLMVRAEPFVGPWQVKWKLSPENEDVLSERFSLDAETTFGNFVNYLSEYLSGYRGFRLRFDIFNSERILVITDE